MSFDELVVDSDWLMLCLGGWESLEVTADFSLLALFQISVWACYWIIYPLVFSILTGLD